MSSIKISELEEVKELTSTDVIPLVTNNETKKISVDSLDKKYATNEKVDNIKTIEQGEIFLIDVPKIPLSGTSGHYLKKQELSAEQQEKILYAFNYCLGHDIKYPVLKVRSSAQTNAGCGSNLFRIKTAIPTPEHLKSYTFEFMSIGMNESSTDGPVPMCMLSISLIYNKDSGYYFNENGQVFSIWMPGARLSTTTYNDGRYLAKTNTTEYTPTGDYQPSTKKYVDDAITNLANVGFTATIVDSLPTSNIKTNTIYMILGENGNDENVYEEWLYINNAWEQIGSTGMDLSQIYTKEEIDEKLDYVNYENKDIPIYHIYGAATTSTVLDTVSKTSDLGVKITETMQQIYDDRSNHSRACIIWHNTHVQASKATYSMKLYVDAYNLSTTTIPVNLESVSYTFNIMPATISNGVVSWSNSYNATISSENIINSSSVLTKTNTTSYTPSKDYHPATKKYVDDVSLDAINNALTMVPETIADKTFQISTGETVTVSTNYTVENISTTYVFALNGSGFYESGNKGQNNSYSLCKVTFNLEYAISLPITVINNGEAKYDFGIFSEVDTELTNDNVTDTTGVFKAFSGVNDSSTTEKTLTYAMPAGEHFIYIKYKKDSSSNNGNDSLQFKIPSEVTTEILKDFTFTSKEYVDDAIANMDIPGGGGFSEGTYYGYLPTISLSSVNPNTDEDWAAISEIFTMFLKRDGNFDKMAFFTSSQGSTRCLCTFAGRSYTSTPDIINTTGITISRFMINPTLKYSGFHEVTYNVTVDSEYNVTATNNSISVKETLETLFLTKNNTTSYTPTSNYNPATKKYVDDAIANIDIPESGGSAIDFGNTPVYLVSTASGTDATAQHYILDNYNAPDYGASLRKAVSSGLKQFIISIYLTGYGMSMDLRYTIDDNGSILVLPIRLPFQVSRGSYIIGYSPTIENMVTNISSVETATMYLRVQNMHNPALCPIEKNTASKSYVDNAIANAITTVLEAEY